MDIQLVNLFGSSDEEERPETSHESTSHQQPPVALRRPSHTTGGRSRRQRRYRNCASVGSIQSLLQTSCSGGSSMQMDENIDPNNIHFLFDPTSEEFVEEEHCPMALPPEVEEGNIEYKRQLVNLTAERFEHLVTQLNWRLTEGDGEAIYELGVEDSGHVYGLNYDEMCESLNTLRAMAARLGAQVTVLRERHVSASDTEVTSSNQLKRSLEVLVKRQPLEARSPEIRLVLLGNMDAGKSTLVGVLSQGELDNGRGRARLNLFRHPHEILSGRTSSISSELLLYDESGELMNPRLNALRNSSAGQGFHVTHVSSVPNVLSDHEQSPRRDADISSQSTNLKMKRTASKIVALIDLAGHWKYQRTTLYGLTSRGPHFAMLVISAASGFVKRSQIHCLLALALRLPLIVVISKCDLAAPDGALQQLQYWFATRYRMEVLGGYSQMASAPLPFVVSTLADAELAAEHVQKTRHRVHTSIERLEADFSIPVFCVSCVTGQGLTELNCFLGKLSLKENGFLPDNHHYQTPSMLNKMEHSSSEDVEFYITQVFQPCSNRGQVLHGLLQFGCVKPGQMLHLGPCNEEGHFVPVRVTSVHKNRLAQCSAVAGEMVSLAIEPVDKQNFSETDGECLSKHPYARRGMVLLQNQPLDSYTGGACWEFDACLYSLLTADNDNDSVTSGHTLEKQYTIYCGAFCQSVSVLHHSSPDSSPDIPETSHAGVATMKQNISVRLRFMRHPEFVQPNKVFIYRNGPSQGHGIVTKLYPIKSSRT